MVMNAIVTTTVQVAASSRLLGGNSTGVDGSNAVAVDAVPVNIVHADVAVVVAVLLVVVLVVWPPDHGGLSHHH